MKSALELIFERLADTTTDRRADVCNVIAISGSCVGLKCEHCPFKDDQSMIDASNRIKNVKVR